MKRSKNEKIEQIIIALPEANQQVLDKNNGGYIYGKVESVKYLPNVNGTMTFSSKYRILMSNY